MTISENIILIEEKIRIQNLILKCTNLDSSKLRTMKVIESYENKLIELKTL